MKKIESMKKMTCNLDTAKQLIKVFGNSIVKDLDIYLTKIRKKKDVKT